MTVTAVDDDVVEGAHTCAIVTGDGSGDGYTGFSVADVTGNITDNDTAGITLTESDGSTDIAEGGVTDDFTIVLVSQPTANVSIMLNPDAQCTLSTSEVTFTPGDWNSAQSVTVTAADDSLLEGSHTCTITTNAASSTDGNYGGLSVVDVTANVTDNDTAGVTVTGSPVAITEGGATGSFSVVLTAQPTANVTISLSSDAQCTLSSDELTFTQANWNSAQSVTVTAVDDNVVEGAHSCAITTGDANGDGYTNVPVADVTANITDNDTAGATVAGSPVAVTENGATGDFTIVLTSQPTANVTIVLTSDDPAQCTLSASDLTFAPGNWSSLQSVTITAIDNDVNEGAHSCTITTGNTSSSDITYNGLDVANVTANIADDDGPAGPSASLVQKTFESETHNFMAARARLLARLGPRNYRWGNRQDGEFQMGSNGINIEGEGGNLVGNFALNSGAVRRIINGDFLNVTPTADVPEPSGGRLNAWIEGQFAYYDSDDDDAGNPEGNFFVAYAGVDVKVFDRVLIGVMGQLDWLDEDSDTGKTNGDGWMVGPYISAELAPNLFFDLRGMYGQSDNSSTQNIQNFEYAGDFDTERWFVEVILSGRFDYGNTVFTPDLQFTYIWEDQKDYTVSSGNDVVDVNGQVVKLGQLSSGLKVAEKIEFDDEILWPYVAGRVFWDFDNPGGLAIDGSAVSTDDIRAAITLGLNLSTQSSQVSVEATYDGLFADDYESIGGRVSFSHRL